jgi:disulfide bond formation protein DsbB
MNISNKLQQLISNQWYWLFFLCLGLSLEGMALFYQYYLDYMPCVLCIHIRIWVLAIIVVSFVASFVYQYWQSLLLVQFLMTGVIIGLFERSYQLLGIEQGFLSGSCSMASGLPRWFALDDWFPALFAVQEPCGYTPELLLGITMAEALIVLSSLLLMSNFVLLINLVMSRLKK